jgi:hypothetical protein
MPRMWNGQSGVPNPVQEFPGFQFPLHALRLDCCASDSHYRRGRWSAVAVVFRLMQFFKRDDFKSFMLRSTRSPSHPPRRRRSTTGPHHRRRPRRLQLPGRMAPHLPDCQRERPLDSKALRVADISYKLIMPRMETLSAIRAAITCIAQGIAFEVFDGRDGSQLP